MEKLELKKVISVSNVVDMIPEILCDMYINRVLSKNYNEANVYAKLNMETNELDLVDEVDNNDSNYAYNVVATIDNKQLKHFSKYFQKGISNETIKDCFYIGDEDNDMKKAIMVTELKKQYKIDDKEVANIMLAKSIYTLDDTLIKVMKKFIIKNCANNKQFRKDLRRYYFDNLIKYYSAYECAKLDYDEDTPDNELWEYIAESEKETFRYWLEDELKYARVDW